MTLLLALSSPALACGGFFCDNVQPVEQAGEQIVFAIDEEAGTVSVQVRVTYEGPSEAFAWIVPVPAIPELGVSSNALFDLLSAATAPIHTLTQRDVGCPSVESDADTDSDTDADTDADTDSDIDESVEVVGQAEVGPYDTVTLQADSSAALVTWLQENGYDVPDTVESAIAPYVAQGQYLLALKLLKDRDAGDLQPIAMTYPGDVASIPIQLTAVAARPGMPLEVYVFADHRAVPLSYYHVTPNPFTYDWFEGTVDWADTIGRAADEAGGHAFATDHAGATASLAGMFYQGEYETGLVWLPQAADAAEWWAGVVARFAPSAALLDVFRRQIPLPAGLDETSFYNCVSCYAEEIAGVPFDAVVATADLDASVVQPLRDAEALVGAHTHLTRMTSSLDAAEMTLDPTFGLNPDMPQDVAREHSAELVRYCMGGDFGSALRTFTVLPEGYRVGMPSSDTLAAQGLTDYEYLSDLGAHAALLIERTSTSGQATVIADERPWLEGALSSFASDGRRCGCQAAPLASAAWWLVLWPLVRRRTRSARPGSDGGIAA